MPALKYSSPLVGRNGPDLRAGPADLLLGRDAGVAVEASSPSGQSFLGEVLVVPIVGQRDVALVPAVAFSA